MRMEFDGLEELQRRLSRMANAKAIEKAALEKAGEYMVEKLEEKVYSYGLKKRSGLSQKSFLVNKEIVNGAIKVGLSNQNNDAFYLYFHEHGAKNLKARPFMRPTFEQEKNNIERVMADEIRRELGL